IAPFPAERQKATVVTLPPAVSRRPDLAALGTRFAQSVIPPLVVLLVLLCVWQVAFSGPGSSLPPPSEIWNESRDLILDPFFVNGTQDIGLGWRVIVSLEWVAIGFGLAAVGGVLLGALVGQPVWMMRGLDPIFQVLRPTPPLAWLPISLAAFMDSRP